MRFIDMGLVRRLEYAEAGAAEECVRNAEPGKVTAAMMRVAGGLATFTGVDSPITQAVAMGLEGPVTAEDMDKLEEFFFSRGAAVNIEMCPMADGSLMELLGKRGHRVIEFSNVCFMELGEKDKAGVKLPKGVEVRKVGREESRLWARTVMQGFATEAIALSEDLVDVMVALGARGTVECLLVTVNGEPAGGAAVAIDKGMGGCFGASTLPAFRRRGIQMALLDLRLSEAARRGCDMAMCIAQPGSASHRNLERRGFRVAYTRVKFMRERDSQKS